MEAKQWGNFENPQKTGRDLTSPDKIEILKDDYAFCGFVGKEPALLHLQHLLGRGCVNGGCILVTGCRGAGKTTLVNRAIYEAGLLGRYDVSKSKHDPFKALKEKLKTKGKVELHIKKDNPTLLIEVRVNISSPITADSLIRRLVRSFYWSLVGSGIAGLVPELMESARLAYIRTIGQVDQTFEKWLKETEQLKSNIKITSKEGLEVQVGAAAQAELQIAQKMALHLGISQKEEILKRKFFDYLIVSKERLLGSSQVSGSKLVVSQTGQRALGIQ